MGDFWVSKLEIQETGIPACVPSLSPAEERSHMSPLTGEFPTPIVALFFSAVTNEEADPNTGKKDCVSST